MSRKFNILGQILRQKIQKLGVPLLVKQWRIDELSILIRVLVVENSELEVQSCNWLAIEFGS